MFLPAQLHYPPIHHQTDHFTLGSSGLTLSASVSLTLSPATITGCLDTAVASILSHLASIPSPFQAIVPMKTSQGCLFTAPSGSCHSDYYLFLLGQDPTPLHGKVPGSSCPLLHPSLTMAFWALAALSVPWRCCSLFYRAYLVHAAALNAATHTPDKALFSSSPAQATLHQEIFTAPTLSPYPFTAQVLCHTLSENHASFLENTYLNLQLHIHWLNPCLVSTRGPW